MSHSLECDVAQSKNKVIASLRTHLDELEKLNRRSLVESIEIRMKYEKAEVELDRLRELCKKYENHMQNCLTKKKDDDMRPLMRESEHWKRQCENVIRKLKKLELNAALVKEQLAPEQLDVTTYKKSYKKNFIMQNAVVPRGGCPRGVLDNYVKAVERNVSQQDVQLGLMLGNACKRKRKTANHSFAKWNFYNYMFHSGDGSTFLNGVMGRKDSCKQVQSLVLMVSEKVRCGRPYCDYPDCDLKCKLKGAFDGTPLKKSKIPQSSKRFSSKAKAREQLNKNISFIRAQRAEKQNSFLSNQLENTKKLVAKLQGEGHRTTCAIQEYCDEIDKFTVKYWNLKEDYEYAMGKIIEQRKTIETLEKAMNTESTIFVYVELLKKENDFLKNLVSKHPKLKDAISSTVTPLVPDTIEEMLTEKHIEQAKQQLDALSFGSTADVKTNSTDAVSAHNDASSVHNDASSVYTDASSVHTDAMSIHTEGEQAIKYESQSVYSEDVREQIPYEAYSGKDQSDTTSSKPSHSNAVSAASFTAPLSQPLDESDNDKQTLASSASNGESFKLYKDKEGFVSLDAVKPEGAANVDENRDDDSTTIYKGGISKTKSQQTTPREEELFPTDKYGETDADQLQEQSPTTLNNDELHEEIDRVQGVSGHLDKSFPNLPDEENSVSEVSNRQPLETIMECEGQSRESAAACQCLFLQHELEQKNDMIQHLSSQIQTLKEIVALSGLQD